jgi:protein gp37
MGLNTGIEWTDATWNPSTGCDRVSEGCDNCYALALAKRLKAMGNRRYSTDGNARTSGPGFGLTLHEDKLHEPYSWRKPRRVFVNSMSDLFHSKVPPRFIWDVFQVMADLPQHQFQILTKRPRRMLSTVRKWYELSGMELLPNVWLGTSVENQLWANRRVPLLQQVPAEVRFISCEPLLGRVELESLTGIHWVIVGGESGPRARLMDEGWVRGVRDQCLEEGVAFFLKQWGGRTPKANGRTLDGRTWDQFPAAVPTSA